MALDVDESIQELKLKYGLAEKDILTLNVFCEKLSESIQKIQELNVNFVKMISLCEQRHVRHDEVEKVLEEDIKEIHSRISSVSADMYNRMLHIESAITKKIDGLVEDLSTNYCRQSDAKPLMKSIEKYDTIKWMIIGGALAIGWLLGNLDFEFLGNIIK